MFIALALATLASAPAEAKINPRVQCLGRTADQRAVYLEGNFASLGRIEKLQLQVFSSPVVRFARERVSGRLEEKENGPCPGTRFDLQTGNPAAFLLLDQRDSVKVWNLFAAPEEAIRRAMYAPRFSFQMVYVVEGVGQGEFRSETALACGPKAVD